MEEDQILQDALIEEFDEITQQIEPVDQPVPSSLTILPLNSRPVFPGLPLPLSFSGKDKLETLRRIMDEEDGWMGLVLARHLDEEDYSQSDFADVGVAFKILRIVPVGQQAVQVLGQGVTRFTREKTLLVKPQLRWQVSYPPKKQERPDADLKAFRAMLDEVGFRYWEETDNPAYTLFLGG